jgi:hypothetical protein
VLKEFRRASELIARVSQRRQHQSRRSLRTLFAYLDPCSSVSIHLLSDILRVVQRTHKHVRVNSDLAIVSRLMVPEQGVTWGKRYLVRLGCGRQRQSRQYN